jgi:hypothetical protein
MAIAKLPKSPLRLLYIVVGALMVVYGLMTHGAIPGIPFDLLIIGGILLLIAGFS